MDVFHINDSTGSISSTILDKGSPVTDIKFEAHTEFDLNFFDTPDDSMTQAAFSSPNSVESSTSPEPTVVIQQQKISLSQSMLLNVKNGKQRLGTIQHNLVVVIDPRSLFSCWCQQQQQPSQKAPIHFLNAHIRCSREHNNEKERKKIAYKFFHSLAQLHHDQAELIHLSARERRTRRQWEREMEKQVFPFFYTTCIHAALARESPCADFTYIYNFFNARSRS